MYYIILFRVRVPPRDASKKIQASGAFAQAKVTRGEDWRYGDQDGKAKKKYMFVSDLLSF